MTDRPSGAVTFLFTDVEGSTRAWEERPIEMASHLEVHDRVLTGAIKEHKGFVFATGGDSFSAAFGSPSEALAAAIDAQRGLVASGCQLKVRMGVHSGEAIERDGNYYGPPLNRTARLMSIGHGGQVLVSSVTRQLVSGGQFGFIELGEHRLADLTAPVRVAQLAADGLATSFPPLRSVVATDNLPRVGEILGRDSDVQAVTELLKGHRLVTLTGPGGIGKTTLAVSVATHALGEYPEGRWFVDLTDLPSGSEPPAIAGAVSGVDDRFAGLEAMGPRHLLLVIDNCEHVLDGVRGYIDDLRHVAPDVSVIATSREALRVKGERVFPVQPLSVESGSDHSSAVELFVMRAEQAGVVLDQTSDFATIAAICLELGGLPLAIELAAA